MYNLHADYGISDEGDNIGYYFNIAYSEKILNIDKKTIVICCYISKKNGLIQISTIVDRNDYNKSKLLYDNIVKS